jgi:hypothetical protein
VFSGHSRTGAQRCKSEAFAPTRRLVVTTENKLQKIEARGVISIDKQRPSVPPHRVRGE